MLMVPDCPPNRSSDRLATSTAPVAWSKPNRKVPEGCVLLMAAFGFTVELNAMGLLPEPPNRPGMVRVPVGLVAAS